MDYVLYSDTARLGQKILLCISIDMNTYHYFEYILKRTFLHLAVMINIRYALNLLCTQRHDGMSLLLI